MTVDTVHRGAEVALPTVTGGDLPGLAILQQWATANDQASRLVSQWVFTDLVPVHHWPTPPGVTLKDFPNPRRQHPRETPDDYRRRCEIAVASASGTVLRGISIGLPPNIALEQMFSVHGTIGMKTKAKLALAKSRGRKAWDVLLTEQEVRCAGIDPVTGETVEIGITWEQAEKAGWTSNAAYGKTPIDMLWSRAMSRVLDRIAGDVLFGLASVEDIDPVPAADVEVTATVTTPAPAERPSAAAALAAVRPAVVDEPVAAAVQDTDQAAGHDMPPEVTPPAAPEAPAEVIDPASPCTEWQRRAIGRAFAGLDVSGTGQERKRATVVAHVVEHPVGALAELTYGEAEHLLGYLGAEEARQAVHAVLAAAEVTTEPEGWQQP